MPQPCYLVEFFLPPDRSGKRAALAAAIAGASEAVSAEGQPVRFLHAVSVPGDDLYLCFFEARTVAAIDEVRRRAGLPFEARPEPVEFIHRGGQMESTI